MSAHPRLRLIEEVEGGTSRKRKAEVLEDTYEWLSEWKNYPVVSTELRNRRERCANQVEHELKCMTDVGFFKDEEEEQETWNYGCAGRAISTSANRTRTKHDDDHQQDKLVYVCHAVDLLCSNMLNRYNQEKQRETKQTNKGLPILHGTTASRAKVEVSVSSLDSSMVPLSSSMSLDLSDDQRDTGQQQNSSVLVRQDHSQREEAQHDQLLRRRGITLRRTTETYFSGTSSECINDCASALLTNNTTDNTSAGLLPYLKADYADDLSMVSWLSNQSSAVPGPPPELPSFVTTTPTNRRITSNNSDNSTIRLSKVDTQNMLWITACILEEVNKLSFSGVRATTMIDHDQQDDGDAKYWIQCRHTYMFQR